MHSSHWSHQHSMTATRKAATRLRLDWTEAGPTLPHSTLVHVQVTECSTATHTHAAGAQDGSQSALTAGPNPTNIDQHNTKTHHQDCDCSVRSREGLEYKTARQPSCHVGSADRGSSSNHNSPLDSAFCNTVGLLSIHPLPRPNASTTRSPPTSSQRPSLTRWSRVEL